MRAGSESGQFDLSDTSDTRADTLDCALSVAAEIAYEYALCPGHTRIEVLARCLALNLGESQGCGYVEPIVYPNGLVEIPWEWSAIYDTTQIRMLMGMLARAAERAEQ